MTLAELGLTPTQYAECESLDRTYVDSWLASLASTPNVKNPAGWFLAGIRTGRLPGEQADTSRTTKVRLAETWIRNAGHYEPSEQALLDALFGEHGRLKTWADDQALRDRMVKLWEAEHPRGVAADTAQLERAQRWKAQHA